ncbi:hypothetical protein UC8_53790 [Roseimaritima ulvae]|uniref:Uncharacterized protein n=1 Tax=Roseimaritima ulvae TaxID=980254 RepID=A0A5B9QZ44_9BACT|nr:hypothetical protein UC8_53790 [Roseimaritima ulvae]
MESYSAGQKKVRSYARQSVGPRRLSEWEAKWMAS